VSDSGGRHQRPPEPKSLESLEQPRVDISRFLAASADHPEDDPAGPPGPVRRVTRNRWFRSTVRIGSVVVIAVLVAVLLRAFVVQSFYIPSQSMEPTLHGCPRCDDDRVLVDKISYRIHSIHDGDIVVFHRPPLAETTDKILIKRVVAVGGDQVELRGGHLLRNGKELVEPYVNKACGPRPDTPLNGTTRWTVPRGDVFVMGDNRCDSEDSRQFGPITDSSVIGRAFAIVWPLSRLRWL
jgi:signal peptidase I